MPAGGGGRGGGPRRVGARGRRGGAGGRRRAARRAPRRGAAVHAECRRAVEDAAELCGELGHEVAEAAPPVPAGYFAWDSTGFLAAGAPGVGAARAATS